MKMISLTFLLFSSLSGAVYSEETVEVKDMGQILAQITMEKKQMEIIVDKLVSSGRLSTEYANKAKREIASVKEEDVKDIKMNIVAVLATRSKN